MSRVVRPRPGLFPPSAIGKAALACVAILAWSAVVLRQAKAAPTRLALVVGNAQYAAGPLRTAANDAGLIARELAGEGYTVTGYADLDREALRRAFATFLDSVRQAGPGGVAFVYLAGYGVQFAGDNYMMPVDATVARDTDVPAEAVSLSDFTRDLAGVPLKARVVVGDLAHPAPFPQHGMPLANGLAPVVAPPSTLVAFNTAPGLTASADIGDYGLYAQALAELMPAKALPAASLFTRVRVRVAALSNGSTVPWADGAPDQSVSLEPLVAATTTSFLAPLRALVESRSETDAFWAAVRTDTLAGYQQFRKSYPGSTLGSRIDTLLATRREATLWMQSRRADTSAAYWTYMRFYPRGPHYGDARHRLGALGAALEPPPRFALFAYEEVTPPQSWEQATADRTFVAAADGADGQVPAPVGTDVPSLRPEAYERLPPLLAVAPGTLPLPMPRTTGAPDGGSGQIVQPGAGDPVVAIFARDATGAATVTQRTQTAVVSLASVTPGPAGVWTVLQTGPEGRPLATMIETMAANGSRTAIQTGPDKRIMATATTVVAPDGSRVTTVAGAGGQAIAVVALNTTQMSLTPVSAAGGRPPRLEARQPTIQSAVNEPRRSVSAPAATPSPSRAAFAATGGAQLASAPPQPAPSSPASSAPALSVPTSSLPALSSTSSPPDLAPIAGSGGSSFSERAAPRIEAPALLATSAPAPFAPAATRTSVFASAPPVSFEAPVERVAPPSSSPPAPIAPASQPVPPSAARVTPEPAPAREPVPPRKPAVVAQVQPSPSGHAAAKPAPVKTTSVKTTPAKTAAAGKAATPETAAPAKKAEKTTDKKKPAAKASIKTVPAKASAKATKAAPAKAAKATPAKAPTKASSKAAPAKRRGKH